MKKYISEIILLLISAFFSGFSGYYFAIYKDSSTPIKHYKFVSEKLIEVPDEMKGLKITYQGKEIKQISKFTQTIRNTSNKNLDTVKFEFDFPDKKTLPIFYVGNGPKEYAKESIKFSSKEKGNYLIELDYLNKSRSTWDTLAFEFFFAGESVQEPILRTGTKGITLEEDEIFSTQSYFFNTLKKLWWLLAVAAIFIYIDRKMRIALKNLEYDFRKKEYLKIIQEKQNLEEASRIFDDIEDQTKLFFPPLKLLLKTAFFERKKNNA